MKEPLLAAYLNFSVAPRTQQNEHGNLGGVFQLIKYCYKRSETTVCFSYCYKENNRLVV